MSCCYRLLMDRWHHPLDFLFRLGLWRQPAVLNLLPARLRTAALLIRPNLSSRSPSLQKVSDVKVRQNGCPVSRLLRIQEDSPDQDGMGAIAGAQDDQSCRVSYEAAQHLLICHQVGISFTWSSLLFSYAHQVEGKGRRVAILRARCWPRPHRTGPCRNPRRRPARIPRPFGNRTMPMGPEGQSSAKT